MGFFGRSRRNVEDTVSNFFGNPNFVPDETAEEEAKKKEEEANAFEERLTKIQELAVKSFEGQQTINARLDAFMAAGMIPQNPAQAAPKPQTAPKIPMLDPVKAAELMEKPEEFAAYMNQQNEQISAEYNRLMREEIDKVKRETEERIKANLAQADTTKDFYANNPDLAKYQKYIPMIADEFKPDPVSPLNEDAQFAAHCRGLFNLPAPKLPVKPVFATGSNSNTLQTAGQPPVPANRPLTYTERLQAAYDEFQKGDV